jgi:hypothetical protein
MTNLLLEFEMRINVDRLCKLAGLGGGSNSKMLNEASNRSYHDDPALAGERDIQFGKDQLSETSEGDASPDDDAMEEDMPVEEMIEVDEVMLVQELRRAKKLMSESHRRKQNLENKQLKNIIEEEVRNVMRDLNLNSSWIYGNKKPKRSRKGFVHQGSFLKGIGFE